MINETGQRLVVLTEYDAQVLFYVEQGQKFTVRSEKQAKNDKFFNASLLKKVQIKGRFNKVMIDNDKVIELIGDSYGTYFALTKMSKYLVPNYNVLLKNGAKYKCSDLAKDMNITRQTASFHIKKLKELNLIAEVETNKGRLFAINPYYIHQGTQFPELITNLFEKPTNVRVLQIDIPKNGESN